MSRGEWKKGGDGWWDYKYDGALVAAYRGDGTHWEILWGGEHPREILSELLYNRNEVRNHIELKYKLLRGEHGVDER